MRKRKILSLVALSIASILVLSSCTINGANNGNGSGNGNNKVEVILPELTSSKQVSVDEMIFVTIDPNGQMLSMNTTNHFENSEFSYYEYYGRYLDNNHLNITSGQGKIIKEENKVLIPSLKENDNYFYQLSLDQYYYIDLLPFKITPKYKLNGYTVGYEKLKGSSGIVEIELKVTPNEETNDYFKDNYGAQIQIPINLNYAKILDSSKAMAKVITGNSATIAYMVMPNTESKITLKLEVKNFSFEGFQATYQLIDLNDMLSSFIDLDELGMSNIGLLKDGVETIINEFNGVYLQSIEFFDGLRMMEELVNNDDLDQIPTLISNLTGLSFRTGYRQPQRVIRTNTENYSEVVAYYTMLADNVETSINTISSAYNSINSALNSLKPKINNVKSYPDKYEKFAIIIEKLNIIDNYLDDLLNLGHLDLNLIANNKEKLNIIFKGIGQNNDEIQTLFQDLILDMQPLAFHLEPLVSDLDSLEIIVEGLIDFSIAIGDLYTNLIVFIDAIEEGQENNIFSPYLDPLKIIDRFVSGVKDGEGDNTSLLEALEMILDQMSDLDIGDAGDFSQLENLYVVNPITNTRQIDELVTGFILMNQALALPQMGQEMSFYQGLKMMNTLTTVLDLIPLAGESDAVSFLDENNPIPTSIQFIIKQQGF